MYAYVLTLSGLLNFSVIFQYTVSNAVFSGKSGGWLVVNIL